MTPAGSNMARVTRPSSSKAKDELSPIPIEPISPQAESDRKSPYSFGHLELFHWRNEANGWQLVGGNSLPATTFLRRSFDGWPGASYAATSVDPSNLLRQLSIIIRPVNGLPNPPECLYEVQLQHPGNGTFGNRIDVVVDDLVTGDIARLLLSNQPAWNLPNVYLNDLNSPDPSTWTLLTPVSVASLGSQSVTAFARPSASTVLLRTVNPDRRHQITITW